MADEPLNLADLRVSYDLGRLDDPAAGAAPSWWDLAARWFQAAIASGKVGQGNAMQVATTGLDGHPSVRSVLCKGLDERGVVFYTNLGSDKSRELVHHPFAEAVIAWVPLERQIRIRGPVSRVSDPEAQQYWAGRPRGSQLGAWASPQSQVVTDRAWLDARFDEVERRFGEDAVPLPPFWGGWRIEPTRVEFWQGGPDRLHDRLLFRRPAGVTDWAVQRLAP